MTDTNNWEREEFRGNINCPHCNALIPQYIRWNNAGVWDTRTECNCCGHKQDYNPACPHGRK